MSRPHPLTEYPGLRRAAAVALAFLLVGSFALVAFGARSHEAEAAWTAPDLRWESEHCGVTETVTVPLGATEVYIVASGGGGGTAGSQFGASGGLGGSGTREERAIAVVPGQVISMVVGCRGADGSASPNDAPTPGWSTGGGAGIGSTSAIEGGASGGAGGGSTGVCIGSSVCTFAQAGTTLQLVSGGGGGGGVRNCVAVAAANSHGGNGGSAPGLVAVNGGDGQSGVDGASSSGAGGAGGVNDVPHSVNGDASADGSGGAGVNVVGGGGGGGYRGGGAGAGAAFGCVGGGGGGGGSSWIRGGTDYLSSGCPSTPSTPPCVAEDGSVSLWFRYAASTSITSNQNPSAPGGTVHFTAEVTDALGTNEHSIDFYVDGVLVADDTDGHLTRTFASAGDYDIEAVYDWTQQAGGRGTSRASLTQHVGYYVTSLPGGPTLPPITLPGSTLPGTTTSAPAGSTTTTTAPAGSTTTSTPSGSTTTAPAGSTTTTTSTPSGSTTSVPSTTIPPASTTTTTTPSTVVATTAPATSGPPATSTTVASTTTVTTTSEVGTSSTVDAAGTGTTRPGGTDPGGRDPGTDPTAGIGGDGALEPGATTLARTGSDLVGLAGIALLAAALGAGVVVFAGRRRRDFRP